MLITSLYRPAAILKAKPGQEHALLDFTLALPLIHKVDGLRRVDVSRSIYVPAELLLFYQWECPAHSERYVSGPVYAKIEPRLQVLMQDHLLVLTEIADHRRPYEDRNHWCG